jgi:hypothetical protein
MELFEQPIKMMEKTTELWQEMINNSLWLKKPETTLAQLWSPWLAGLKSANELNCSACKILMDQGEDMFFRMLKESRLYSQSVESQIRERWETVKKTHSAQREAMESLLGKMESVLARKEDID